MDARAMELGYRRAVLQGEGFSHVAYFKDGHKDGALHVYLEGDGTPWTRMGVPASDPTPRNPLMVELMSLDPATSVYLGRPCYHGLRNSACSPVMWTDRRYSEAVVASMSAALDSATTGYQSLVLLGYSGGGTLAMLLAERQPRVGTIVTVAANLDTDRWAAMHRQPPMNGSLNPTKRPPLRSDVRQMHYAGGEDDNVPSQLVRAAVARRPGVLFREFPRQDHRCCWHEVWSEVLGALAAE
ncbi:MAG: alpha/beta fold hydrolase [Gallionellaceae bacterium]|nr:alpha/beta fold hydrolase [Gallionellaceae bacterium]